MYEIGLNTIVMTSKFVMTLAPIAKDDSFTIRSSYQTYTPEIILEEVVEETEEDTLENEGTEEPVAVVADPGLSVQEINDIIRLWDSADREEILSRFRYAEELTEGFGVVCVNSKKIETVEFSEGGVEKEKTFETIITVKAVEDIASGSILRL